MILDNYKKIKKVLWAILFANIFVALIKIIIGISIKSASLTADGFHSVSDGASNIVGLIGINFASKPIDKEHPYGHKKFEVITSLFIAGMLLFVSTKIISEAFFRFKNPVEMTVNIGNLLVLIVTLAVNVFVCIYEYNAGKKLDSYILISDSLHTRSDIIVSIGVLLTLLGVKLGLPNIIDPIVSLIVSGFILYSAYEIFKASTNILVDTAAIEEEEIKKIVFKFKEVKDIHNIRSRGSENDIHIDMHLMLDPDMSLEESHALNHEIEKRIQEEINSSAQVIIHIEPYYDNNKCN